MKNIKNLDEFSELNESTDFMAKIKSLKSHTNAWNSLVKWYDKQLNHMNMYELAKLLREAADAMDAAEFDVIK